METSDLKTPSFWSIPTPTLPTLQTPSLPTSDFLKLEENPFDKSFSFAAKTPTKSDEPPSKVDQQSLNENENNNLSKIDNKPEPNPQMGFYSNNPSLPTFSRTSVTKSRSMSMDALTAVIEMDRTNFSETTNSIPTSPSQQMGHPLYSGNNSMDIMSQLQNGSISSQPNSQNPSRPTSPTTTSSTTTTTTTTSTTITSLQPYHPEYQSEDQQEGKQKSKKRGPKKQDSSKAAANDPEKRAKFLERNRKAAQKCRQKKKDLMSRLQKETAELEQTHQQLKIEIEKLQQTNSIMRNLLSEHRNCPVNAKIALQKTLSF